jgi:hypothetical protein
VIAIAHREQTVVEWEQELREKEEEANNSLECELGELSSCDADLDTRETALEVDRKSLEDLRTEVLARELAVELKENNLNFRERELAGKEKWLAKRKPQVLADACKRLEELQATRVGEAQKVWDFLGQTETVLMPISFDPLCSRDPVQEVSAVLPLLDSTGAKILKQRKSSAVSWRQRAVPWRR